MQASLEVYASLFPNHYIRRLTKSAPFFLPQLGRSIGVATRPLESWVPDRVVAMVFPRVSAEGSLIARGEVLDY
jgi:hypothetical protein